MFGNSLMEPGLAAKPPLYCGARAPLAATVRLPSVEKNSSISFCSSWFLFSASSRARSEFLSLISSMLYLFFSWSSSSSSWDMRLLRSALPSSSLFTLVWYSVRCRPSSALSSVTRLCSASACCARARAGLPSSLAWLLLRPVPSSSRLWPRSGDRRSSLLLGKGEGSRGPSVWRELQADESLALQAEQLLTEPAEAPQEEAADQAVLATLGVLGKGLAGGTLS